MTVSEFLVQAQTYGYLVNAEPNTIVFIPPGITYISLNPSKAHVHGLRWLFIGKTNQQLQAIVDFNNQYVASFPAVAVSGVNAAVAAFAKSKIEE